MNIEEIAHKLAASQAREAKLRGVILKLIDRWWPLAHTPFMSNTARELFKEASDAIQPPYDDTALQTAILQGQREILLKVADTLFENEQHYARNIVMKPVKEL